MIKKILKIHHKGHLVFYIVFVIIFIFTMTVSMMLLGKKYIYKSRAEQMERNVGESSEQTAAVNDNQRLKELNYLKDKASREDLTWDETYRMYQLMGWAPGNYTHGGYNQPLEFIYDPKTGLWRLPGPGDNTTLNAVGQNLNLGTDRPGGSATNPGSGGNGKGGGEQKPDAGQEGGLLDRE